MTQGFRPIVFIISGMAVLGIIDNVVRFIAPEISLWQFHFLRSALAVPMLLCVGAVFGWRLAPIRLGHVVGRNMFLAIAMVIYFGCLGFMPIATVVAGLFTAPILVMFIDAVWSRRRVGPFRIGAAVFGFVGVLLVLDLSPAEVSADLDWITFVPLLAGLSYAFGNVATRKWCEGESAFALLWSYFAIMGVIGGVGLVWLGVFGGGEDYLTRSWAWPSPFVWGLLVAQAVFSLLGIGMVMQAYLIGDPTRVTIFEYSMMLFASGTAWIAFGESLSIGAMLGLGIIIASGVVIAVRER